MHITRWRTRSILAAALFALATSCGSTELEIEPTFDGDWVVSELQLDGRPIALGTSIEIEINTAEAAVRGLTACGEFFGSYTLIDTGAASGRASFTIPSPPPGEPCAQADRADHAAVVAALESVTQWYQESPALRLERATATDQTQLVLTPAG